MATFIYYFGAASFALGVSVAITRLIDRIEKGGRRR